VKPETRSRGLRSSKVLAISQSSTQSISSMKGKITLNSPSSSPS